MDFYTTIDFWVDQHIYTIRYYGYTYNDSDNEEFEKLDVLIIHTKSLF